MKIFDFFDGDPPEFVENRFFAVVFMCDDSISVYEDLFFTYIEVFDFLDSFSHLTDDSLKAFIFPVFIRKGGV